MVHILKLCIYNIQILAAKSQDQDIYENYDFCTNIHALSLPCRDIRTDNFYPYAQKLVVQT